MTGAVRYSSRSLLPQQLRETSDDTTNLKQADCTTANDERLAQTGQDRTGQVSLVQCSRVQYSSVDGVTYDVLLHQPVQHPMRGHGPPWRPVDLYLPIP